MWQTVYVLGAGFSKFATIPLLDEFLHEARRMFSNGSVPKDGSDYPRFEHAFRHVARLEACGKYVDFNFHNLEDVFGLIEIADTLGDHGEPNYPLLSCFKRMVRFILQDKQKRLAHGGILSVYSQFLIERVLKKADLVSVITFNYDEVIEIVTRTCQERNPSVALPKLRDFYNEKASGVPLLKLHGSIGWTARDNDPFLLPPTWNKAIGEQQFRDILYPIWGEASTRLSAAEQIIFIGYSFPATDQYFRQFLAFSLSRNSVLQRIVVINPDKSVADRFRAVVDAHFHKYFHWCDAKFEDLIEPNINLAPELRERIRATVEMLP